MKPLVLTDELFMSGQRCQRRAFLDLYGNLAERQTSSDYLLKLTEDSACYRQQVIATYRGVHPRDSHQGDNLVEATATLMGQGVKTIVQGQIIRQDSSGLLYRASPDLLIKQPGLSRFGPWCYLPITIKAGRRLKMDYQLQALFQGFVLAGFQDLWPPKVGVIIREMTVHKKNPKPYWISWAERLDAFQMVLTACQRNLGERVEPEVFITRSRCSLCVWLNHCTDLARSQRHLSLLPGVTPKRYAALQTLGITTLETLSITPPHLLTPLPGFGETVSHQLLRQARSTLTQQALLHTPPHSLLPLEDPVEFYFDIEAQPDLNLVYLHGVLQVQRGQAIFHGFLAEHRQAEQQVWQDFLALVTHYPQAPIYHFCPYEVECLRRLGKQYRTPKQVIDRLVHRCVDLHDLVTRTVTLPVESYALKSIARWLGFAWREEAVNGAQAICWYGEWLRTGDRAYLQKILEYNEDDCRATYRLKTWLAEFFQAATTVWRPAEGVPSESQPLETALASIAGG